MKYKKAANKHEGLKKFGCGNAWRFYIFTLLNSTRMDGLVIRKATPHDTETLLRFEQGVIEAERPFDPTLKRSPIQYYDLEHLLTSADATLMVAEHKGRLIASGYARIEQAKPYHQHQQYAYLGFMYVHPDYRGKGLNSNILEALKQWTRSKGLTELRLEVYTGNEAAIKAYEKAGFAGLLLEMRMGL